MDLTQPHVTLVYNNGKNKIDLPIAQSTLGAPAIDIQNIAQTGLYTFDPGFCATANCQSEITVIDGEKSLLYYRGYPIEELAASARSISAKLCAIIRFIR